MQQLVNKLRNIILIICLLLNQILLIYFVAMSMSWDITNIIVGNFKGETHLVELFERNVPIMGEMCRKLA